jgi:hypothetical protein
MTCDGIDPQQNDDMDLLMELSDEALEVACGEQCMDLQLWLMDLIASPVVLILH